MLYLNCTFSTSYYFDSLVLEMVEGMYGLGNVHSGCGILGLIKMKGEPV